MEEKEFIKALKVNNKTFDFHCVGQYDNYLYWSLHDGFSNATRNLTVVKTNADLEVVWSREFNVFGDFVDSTISDKGDILFVGSFFAEESRGFCLLNTDADGNINSFKKYESSDGLSVSKVFIEKINSNFVVATYSSVYLINESGEVLKKNKLKRSETSNFAIHTLQIYEGSIFIIGTTFISGRIFTLVNFDEDLNVVKSINVSMESSSIRIGGGSGFVWTGIINNVLYYSYTPSLTASDGTRFSARTLVSFDLDTLTFVKGIYNEEVSMLGNKIEIHDGHLYIQTKSVEDSSTFVYKIDKDLSFVWTKKIVDWETDRYNITAFKPYLFHQRGNQFLRTDENLEEGSCKEVKNEITPVFKEYGASEQDFEIILEDIEVKATDLEKTEKEALVEVRQICPEIPVIDISKSSIEANPTEIKANGLETSTITVQLIDTKGRNITNGGENVKILSNLGTVGEVVDNANGTYTAILSGNKEGSAELSFSVADKESTNKTNVEFLRDTEPFITTWQTTTDNESITIPTAGGDYNYTVDWGDGFIESEFKGNATHVYAKPGIYTVKIKGSFPQIFFNNQGDKDKILTIEQWGVGKWISMLYAFFGCSNLTSNASDVPNLSLATTTHGMFYQATSFNADLNNWDVSNITNMAFMFSAASNFNGDISNWDVVSVKDMSSMFSRAEVFNSDISDWDVNEVTNMRAMFNSAQKFNQDLSKWSEKVIKVDGMQSMFAGAKSFNSDISNWNVRNVTNMSAMFNGAEVFNSDISNWNVSNVENMSFMFSGARSFNSDISNWNVGKVIDMNNMFQNAAKFNSDLNNWNVSSVINMRRVFAGASEFNSDLNKWGSKLSKVITMHEMFQATNHFDSDLNNWDVTSVIDMEGMFGVAKSFNSSLNNWDVSNVTNMSRMFQFTDSFDQNLGDWDVSNVTDMSGMFKSAKLSTENYDASLIGWSKQNLQENVPFDGGNSNYCDGEKAREDIISKFNWTITDSGRDIACVQLDLTKSTITAVPQNVNINKGKSSVITVQLKDELGNSFTRPTELVSIASTKGVINTIQNLGNGLYQTQLRDDSVGSAIVSYKVGEENGIQNALVSFYQPLGCQIAFNIKADQDITGAKGRYRLVSNSEARSETSWNVFDILDFNNSLTPLIREEGEYQLEVMIKGENGVWTDWYSHSSFIINDCQAVERASVEVYKGDCKAVIRGEIKLFFENNDAGIKLYKDASLRIPFDGNDESYVVLNEVSESDASREVSVVKTVVFNVSSDGVVSNLRPCGLGDISDNVEDES